MSALHEPRKDSSGPESRKSMWCFWLESWHRWSSTKRCKNYFNPTGLKVSYHSATWSRVAPFWLDDVCQECERWRSPSPWSQLTSQHTTLHLTIRVMNCVSIAASNEPMLRVIVSWWSRCKVWGNTPSLSITDTPCVLKELRWWGTWGTSGDWNWY